MSFFLGIKHCTSSSSTGSFDLTVSRAIVRIMVKHTISLLFSLAFILSSIASPTTISAPPFSENHFPQTKDNLKSIFGHCLHKKDVVKCLKRRVVDVIDDVTQSNEPLSASFFNLQLSLNKNPQFKGKSDESDSSRTFEDIFVGKLRNLLESRLIQVKVTEDAEIEDDADESAKGLEEARKKKGGGGKHGMMMSGKCCQNFGRLLNLNVF